MTIDKNELLRVSILKKLYYKDLLSLTELSRLTHKSLPLVTKFVNALVAEGYIKEEGLAASTGGRRASLFLLNPDRHKYIVSVAMDQFTTRLAIYDVCRKMVYPVQTMELELPGAAEAVEKLIDFIAHHLQASGIATEKIVGIGMGVPGFIDLVKGIDHSHLNAGEGKNLAKYMSKKLGLPVYLDNDSSLIALAELKFGAAQGKRNVMVANIGWGTGLGMIVNGQLYRGSTGYAGEFSHIPLSNTNNLCSCGKRGCLEVETSLLVMAKRAEEEIRNGAASSLTVLFKEGKKNSGELFLEAARNRDPLAVSILSDAAFMIGKGLATLIHIMNPECIILSGRGAGAGKVLIPPIQQAVNEFCIPRIADQTQILLSELAEDAELLAAASLVVENIHFIKS